MNELLVTIDDVVAILCSSSFRSIAHRIAGYNYEDIIQETFIAAQKNLHTFNGKCKLSTWLTRIFINKSIGQYRKIGNRPDRFVDINDLDIPTFSNIDQKIALDDAIDKAIRMNKFQNKERNAKMLKKFIIGDGISDIAKRYKLTKGTVSVIIDVYRHQIRENLNGRL
jgi:RNA polymerase sigma factor (sigma-70 family)